MIFIWFSEEDYGQTTRVDSNARQSSGMALCTSLRVLTFTEQNKHEHKYSMNTNGTMRTKGSRVTGSYWLNWKCTHIIITTIKKCQCYIHYT